MKSNGVQKLVSWLGIIILMVGSLVALIIFFISFDEEELFAVSGIVFCGSLLTGVFYIGLGELIGLVWDVRNKICGDVVTESYQNSTPTRMGSVADKMASWLNQACSDVPVQGTKSKGEPLSVTPTKAEKKYLNERFQLWQEGKITEEEYKRDYNAIHNPQKDKQKMPEKMPDFIKKAYLLTTMDNKEANRIQFMLAQHNIICEWKHNGDGDACDLYVPKILVEKALEIVQAEDE